MPNERRPADRDGGSTEAAVEWFCVERHEHVANAASFPVSASARRPAAWRRSRRCCRRRPPTRAWHSWWSRISPRLTPARSLRFWRVPPPCRWRRSTTITGSNRSRLRAAGWQRPSRSRAAGCTCSREGRRPPPTRRPVLQIARRRPSPPGDWGRAVRHGDRRHTRHTGDQGRERDHLRARSFRTTVMPAPTSPRRSFPVTPTA